MRTIRENKVKHFAGTTRRLLSKIRDFYVQKMVTLDCRVGGYPAPQPSLFPKNFGLCRKSNEKGNEDIKGLFRSASKRKAEIDMRGRKGVSGYNGVGRSCSVGLGRIGTIEEDKPYDFEEDEVEVEVLFPRSRSYAVPNRNFGHF